MIKISFDTYEELQQFCRGLVSTDTELSFNKFTPCPSCGHLHGCLQCPPNITNKCQTHYHNKNKS